MQILPAKNKPLFCSVSVQAPMHKTLTLWGGPGPQTHVPHQ